LKSRVRSKVPFATNIFCGFYYFEVLGNGGLDVSGEMIEARHSVGKINLIHDGFKIGGI